MVTFSGAALPDDRVKRRVFLYGSVRHWLRRSLARRKKQGRSPASAYWQARRLIPSSKRSSKDSASLAMSRGVPSASSIDGWREETSGSQASFYHQSGSGD